ncbi:MAG TPA: hypothetical protein VEC99_02120 [Clostridia bacterium]|nr:hypothetical protein [Clostridia bacterium]
MRLPLFKLVGFIACLQAMAHPGFASDSTQPFRQHPKNPHYFEWRGRAMALVTSAEHYGAVLNLDFDFRRYLDTMQRDGMNYTRLFSGSYVEPVGAFGIARNTLAPGPERFLSPWSRSNEPGYAGKGNKFDLNKWNPDYLARLKDFIAEAGKRGIVVELTLFCSTYSDQQWAVSPFNPSNNVNQITLRDWRSLNTLGNGNAFAFQANLVRYLVRELNSFDNLFYEIQNEPWADNHVMGDYINPYLANQHQFPNAVEVTTPNSVAWQAAITKVITEEEAKLPNKHLIAQNIANFRLPVRAEDMAPGVSVLNFHYAYPEAVTWNYGLGKVIGYDETGFAGSADATYRRQAWNFILSGGGLFNSLDYSFSVGHEDGTDSQLSSPGGGSPALRQQLKVLSQFLHSFDLASLVPDANVVKQSPGAVTRALSAPGKAYAFYLRGRAPVDLVLDLPKGSWRVEWVNVLDGEITGKDQFSHRGGLRTLHSPDFADDIALRVVRAAR